MPTSPAKTIKVDAETAHAFTLVENHADGRDGFEYVDTIADGIDDHDTPQYQLILRRQKNGALYALTYQAHSEGYSSLNEWKTIDGVLVERRERIVHYYEPVA